MKPNTNKKSCFKVSYENKKPQMNDIPLLFGHTSSAGAGSQYCPCVHGHNPGGSHEASAEWPAEWWGSSRHPGVSPGVGGPCWPWWELPATTKVTQTLPQCAQKWLKGISVPWAPWIPVYPVLGIPREPPVWCKACLMFWVPKNKCTNLKFCTTPHSLSCCSHRNKDAGVTHVT